MTADTPDSRARDHRSDHDHITLGEVVRSLGRVEQWMKLLDGRLDRLASQRIPERIHALESWQEDMNRYAVRIIIVVFSAVVVGIVSIAGAVVTGLL